MRGSEQATEEIPMEDASMDSEKSEKAGGTLAGNIRKYRKMLGLTQAQLAELAGLPRATSAGAERPNSNPTIDVVCRLSQALGVGVDELLKDEEQEVVQVLAKHTKTLSSSDGKYESTHLSPITSKHVIINRLAIQAGGKFVGKPHPPGTQEFLIAHHGEAVLTISKQRIVLKEGDLVAYPGNQPHTYANESDKPFVGYSIMAYVGASS